MSGIAPYRLETLGTLSLSGPLGVISASDQRQQRRRLALLAALACADRQGLSRDNLLLLLWPESTQRKARHSLDQLLYSIRNSINESLFIGVNPIRLDPAVISSDVHEFLDALADGRLHDAVSSYRGAFLDGFYLSESREFEEWVEQKRHHLAQKYEDALESLAYRASLDLDYDAAVRWRRKLSEADPTSSRHTIALMQALEDAGDHSAAIVAGERFTVVAGRQLGAESVTSVRKLVEEMRHATPATARNGLSRTLVAPAAGASAPVITRSPDRAFWKRLALIASVPVIVLLVAFLATSRTDVNPTQSKAVHSGTTSLAAYDYYQRGKDPVLMRNDSTSLVGLSYLTKAVQLDSNFAAAYAGLSTIMTRLGMSDRPPAPRSKLRDDAETFARKAIALDDSLADGHVALGLANSHFAISLALAENEFERAIALDPRAPQAREYLVLARVQLGKRSEALEDARLAVRENPLSPSARSMLAIALYVNGRCDEALPILDSLSQLRPPLLRAEVARSLCLSSQGRWRGAIAAVEQQLAGGKIRGMGVAGFAMARNGERERALAIQKELREITRQNPAAYFDLAVVSFGLGEMDEASNAFSNAADNGVIPWELMGPVFEVLRQRSSIREAALRRGIRLVSH